MLLNIHHQTICRFDHPVRNVVQQLRMTPRSDATQRAVSWHIDAPGRQLELTDAYGNVAHLVTLDEPHDELSITVDGVVETMDEVGYLLADCGPVSPYVYLAETGLTRHEKAVTDFASEHLKLERHHIRALLDLMPPICSTVSLLPEPGADCASAADALATARGAGREHAHLFIACCRANGIPARYVSGYMYTGEDGVAASHAWADAWIGGSGWISFDVTHQRLVDGNYCRLAVGRDDLDACPLRAVRRGAGGCQVTIHAQRR